MKIFEVADIGPPMPTPDPDALMGLVNFLDGRATDTGAQKQISQDAFIKLAQDLDINVTADNLPDIINQPPLNSILEPLDPNTGMIQFKGAGQGPVPMPVNKAQDIVAAAAKSAAKKDRNI